MTTIIPLSNQPIQEVVFTQFDTSWKWAIPFTIGVILCLYFAVFGIPRALSEPSSVGSRVAVTATLVASIGMVIAGGAGVYFKPNEPPEFSRSLLHESFYLVSNWDPNKSALPICGKLTAGSNTVTFRYADNPEPHPGIVSWNVEDNLCTVTLTAEGETK